MESKKEKKRELILDTAFEMILENGYSNTKIIDIANKAGIGKGTIYEYFESKESIVLELLRTKVRQDYTKVCDELGKLPTCKQKLVEYFKHEVETTERYKSNVTDFINEFMRGNTEISMKIVAEVHNIAAMQFEVIHNIIKSGIDAGEFKATEPYAATICFMGSVSFYLSILHFEAHCPAAVEFQPIHPIAGESDLLDCLFNGLLL